MHSEPYSQDPAGPAMMYMPSSSAVGLIHPVCPTSSQRKGAAHSGALASEPAPAGRHGRHRRSPPQLRAGAPVACHLPCCSSCRRRLCRRARSPARAWAAEHRGCPAPGGPLCWLPTVPVGPSPSRPAPVDAAKVTHPLRNCGLYGVWEPLHLPLGFMRDAKQLHVTKPIPRPNHCKWRLCCRSASTLLI